jgi:serine/threonine protein kinase
VAATIQAQNQRSDVCVRDHTPISSETSIDSPVKIVKVLGEGGFSFVYLAQDEVSGVSAFSSCDYSRDVATNTRRVDPERVRLEKDSLSNWRRRS